MREHCPTPHGNIAACAGLGISRRLLQATCRTAAALCFVLSHIVGHLPYLRDVPAFLRVSCHPSRNNLRRLRGIRYFPPALATRFFYLCFLPSVAYTLLRDVPPFLRAGCLPSRNNKGRYADLGISRRLLQATCRTAAALCFALSHIVGHLPYLRDVPAFLRVSCFPSRNNLRCLRGLGI